MAPPQQQQFVFDTTVTYLDDPDPGPLQASSQVLLLAPSAHDPTSTSPDSTLLRPQHHPLPPHHLVNKDHSFTHHPQEPHLGLSFALSPTQTHHPTLSRSRRGSISTPCIATLAANQATLNSGPSRATSPLPTLRTKKSARALISRAVGLGQYRSESDPRLSPIPPTAAITAITAIPPRVSLASKAAIEVLSLIFGHLMDRKTLLNCSLVSTHWHGPARVELARLVRDLPFNGQGLVHAIRTRFASDTFPFISMALFDKLVCNLSELYYHSNPETKQVFAPAHAPDMLYHLFWTFLFIDQEFRNPRARPKVTCNYFVRLLQNEGGGYPREFFDKKVLKNIYNDIRSQPLLPAPHLIRALQEVDGASSNQTEEQPQTDGAGEATRPRSRSGTHHPRQSSSFLQLSGSINLEESFKKVRRWWKTVREEPDQNQVGWVSHVESTSQPNEPSGQEPLRAILGPNGSMLSSTSSSSSSSAEAATTDPAAHARSTSPPPPAPPNSRPESRQLFHSSSLTFPHGVQSLSASSLRSRFGAKSEMSLNKSGSCQSSATSPLLNLGFTTVAPGWHPDGDGLDRVVSFPKTTKPSTLGSRHQILQCSTLLREMDLDQENS